MAEKNVESGWGEEDETKKAADRLDRIRGVQGEPIPAAFSKDKKDATTRVVDTWASMEKDIQIGGLE